jgi:chemotaxis signal transduction protein
VSEKLTEDGQADDGLEESLLVVRIGEAQLGIKTAFVERLLADDLPRTQVPGAPAHVLGVVNFRGAAVAVFDVLAFLGMPPPDAPSKRLVVVRAASMSAAIPVHVVKGIRRIPMSSLRRGEESGALPHTLGLFDLDEVPTHLLDLPRLLQAAAARAA